MAHSSKRYGLVFDQDNWPLTDDWPLTSPPELSMSPSSSVASTEDMQKNMSTDAEFSSFYFSTDDENFDEYEFHRNAALMLAGRGRLQRKDSDFLSEEADQIESESAPVPTLHSNLGRDYYGRSCCSCGKSFSTSFRLREHINQCAGASAHPCASCGKVFKRQSNLNRHIAADHSHGREKCPGCGQHFDAHYLPKHLASGTGRCSVASQDICIVDADLMPQPWWVNGASHDPLATPTASRDSGIDFEDDKYPFPTIVISDCDLEEEPKTSSTEIPCAVCGEQFRGRDVELAQHLGQHSLDFTEKRYLCRECQMFFASQVDLERHARSVVQHQHCGFNFPHMNRPCTGHHPPTENSTDQADDHALMQKHLWDYERTQRHSHRAYVARCLAERVDGGLIFHPLPAQGSRRKDASSKSRFSTSSRDSRTSRDSTYGDNKEMAQPDLGTNLDGTDGDPFAETEEGSSTPHRRSTIRSARDSLRTKSIKNIAKLYKRKTDEQSYMSKSVPDDSSRPSSLPVSFAQVTPAPMVPVS